MAITDLPTILISEASLAHFRDAIVSHQGSLHVRKNGGTASTGEVSEDIYSAISCLFADGYPPECLAPNANPFGSGAVGIAYPSITVIVVNCLDAPLSVTPCTEHGDQTGRPVWVHFNENNGGIETTHDVIPGRQDVLASKKYGVPKAKQKKDVTTFGIGVYTWRKALMSSYGQGGALQFASADPDFGAIDPAVGFYKGFGYDDFCQVSASLSSHAGMTLSKFADTASNQKVTLPWHTSVSTQHPTTAHKGKTKATVSMHVAAFRQATIAGITYQENSVFGVLVEKSLS